MLLHTRKACKVNIKRPLRHQVKGTRQKGRYMQLISYAFQLSKLKSMASRTCKFCQRFSNLLNSQCFEVLQLMQLISYAFQLSKLKSMASRTCKFCQRFSNLLNSQCFEVLRNTFHKKKVLFADIGQKWIVIKNYILVHSEFHHSLTLSMLLIGYSKLLAALYR